MLRKSWKKSVAWMMLGAAMLGGCGNAGSETEQLPKDISDVEQVLNEMAEDGKTEPIQLSVADLAEGEKYQITIGYNPNLVPQYLEAAIVDFNKNNPYYEVVIKEYDWQTGQQRLEAELAAGNGPDLFDLSMIYVDGMVQKGVIEDLSPYLEDGQGIERDDLLESVLFCNTKNDVLTCVPHKFTVDIMLGKKSLIGERSDWTVQEFLKCVEENEGIQIANSIYSSFSSEKYNQYSIVRTAIYRSLSQFIEEENGKAEFDCEEFRQVLKVGGDYKAEAFDYQNNSEYIVQLRDEELLLYQQGIEKVSDFMLAEAALGEEAQFVGFPTYDGSAAWGIRNFISCGMNANSQLKEGAWAFLEYLLTYQMAGEDKSMSYGFHIYKELLEEQYTIAMEKNYMIDEDGKRIEIPVVYYGGIGIYAAESEDIEKLRAIIDGAGYAYGLSSNSIYQIVQEEVLGYLEDRGSVEDTINIIQNRVQLYLDENN